MSTSSHPGFDSWGQSRLPRSAAILAARIGRTLNRPARIAALRHGRTSFAVPVRFGDDKAFAQVADEVNRSAFAFGVVLGDVRTERAHETTQASPGFVTLQLVNPCATHSFN